MSYSVLQPCQHTVSINDSKMVENTLLVLLHNINASHHLVLISSGIKIIIFSSSSFGMSYPDSIPPSKLSCNYAYHFSITTTVYTSLNMELKTKLSSYIKSNKVFKSLIRIVTIIFSEYFIRIKSTVEYILNRHRMQLSP